MSTAPWTSIPPHPPARAVAEWTPPRRVPAWTTEHATIYSRLFGGDPPEPWKTVRCSIDVFGLVIDEARAEPQAEVARLKALLNAPELEDFAGGVVREAAHQRERWGAAQDAGKQPADWFWLIGYLAQKAMMAQIGGDLDKAKHHCISTAAALANWHAALLGADTSMRPGILPPDEAQP